MKITIYELIGLIKDGKAPKKIKINETIYKWVFIHNEFCYADNSINRILLFEHYVRKNKLNKEVEIIEENKKIEYCKGYEDFQGLDDYIEHLKTKINELIDKINNSKEK